MRKADPLAPAMLQCIASSSQKCTDSQPVVDALQALQRKLQVDATCCMCPLHARSLCTHTQHTCGAGSIVAQGRLPAYIYACYQVPVGSLRLTNDRYEPWYELINSGKCQSSSRQVVYFHYAGWLPVKRDSEDT